MSQDITPRVYNKPFPQMTTQELREELAHWETRVVDAKHWTASVEAANNLRKTIITIIAAREADAHAAA